MGNLTAKTSGEIASFMSPSKTNIKSLKVHFSPKQLGTGDPSPENIREIVDWDGVEVNGSGKNLWKYGDLINRQNNQEYDFTYILMPNQEYTFSAIVESTSPYDTCMIRLEGDGLQEKRIQKSTRGERTSVTFNSGSKNYTKIRLYASIRYSQDYYTTYKNIQLELGSTATSYEPYQGNNISYQWKLPDEYQEVKYIESTGTQYIDTGIIGRPNIKVETNFELTDSTNISNCGFIGSRENSGTSRFYIISFYSNKWHLGLPSDITSSTHPIVRNEIQNVIFQSIDGNYSLTVNGTEIYNGNSTFSTTYPMYLFGVNNYGTVSRRSSFKLYTLKIQQDGNYIRNYIPCYRKSDGEIGLYDLISQTFFANQGTGEFLKGEDVFGDAVYGGYVDLVSGELVEEWGMFTVNEPDTTWRVAAYNRITINFPRKYIFGSRLLKDKSMCTILPENHTDWNYGYIDNVASVTNPHSLSLNYTGNGEGWSELFGEEATNENVKEHLQEIGFAICATLATPITHQLTPTQLQSFVGQNNFWSNADYVEIEYDLIETIDIQKCRKKIMLNQPHTESVIDDVVNFTTNIKAPLKECKVYFSPIQEGSGDPSPDNVRNIIGWDGVNVGLPSEYQKVEYIESTGTQWIKTDIKSRPTIEYESIVEFTNGSDQYTVGFKDGNFRASGNGLYSGRTQIVYNTAYKLGVRLSLNKKYKYKTCLKPNEQNVFLDDEMVASYDLPQTETVLSDKHVGIFCQLTNDITPQFFSKIKLTSLVIKENGLLLGNFIPCYRKSDGEIGMYDTVSKTFYTNAGTGTFLKGDNVNTIIGNVNWSDSVGTVYGGYVDLVKGEVVATFKKIVIDGSFDAGIFPWSSDSTDINTGKIITNALYLKKNTGDNKHNRYAIFYCNKLKNISNYNRNEVGCSMYDGSSYSVTLTLPKEDVGDTQETLKTYLSNNPIEVIFELAEPIHYSLTPQQLLTFKGENNIWSDTNGQTEVKFWTH